MAAGVEADPVAGDEDHAVAQEAVLRVVCAARTVRGDPPAEEQRGKRLGLRDCLEGADALAGAGLRRAIRRPADEEVDEGGHEDPGLRRDQQVQFLDAGVVRSAESRTHVDKHREVPQRPHEAEHWPKREEEDLTVCQAVGPHGARVVEAAEEGQGAPAPAVDELQQKKLDGPPVSSEALVPEVLHLFAVANDVECVALDHDCNEDCPHVVQNAVLRGGLASELPHLAQAVQLHDRLSPVGADGRRGQPLLVDLAVGQPWELLDAFELVGHHVGHQAGLAMIAEVRGYGRHDIGHELVLPYRDHGLLHACVGEHRGLDLSKLDPRPPHLDHGVAPANDFEVPGGRPLAEVS
mmetsp:Transcript_71376/g.189803  ORF Transcript_71376/g.189803 Transcript_71376/m.189803 type:complete len:351 (-) Transcript_71376:541-1593(-)